MADQPTSLTAGAEQDSPESIIRKHLSPAMGGPNFDALIAALAVGDDINWTNALLAFDQLFKSTASGKYLDRIAANDGQTRPKDLGMSDELFRLLAIKLTTNKITHQAIREILEIFYGRDALRAHGETAFEEPFALTAGSTLLWTLDETQSFQIEFQQSQFSNIAEAKAVEIAAVLTKAMWDAGSNGFAAAVVDSETGGTKVRIYSGSLGLKSFARVTGGTAQPRLRFPDYVETYSGTVTSGLGYNWVYTVPTQNVTRLSLTTTGIPIVNLTGVESGDYLVIGSGVTGVATGTYRVRDVTTSWSGGSFTQNVDLDFDLGFVGTILQQSNDDYRFFRPVKANTMDGQRTVVVAQTLAGQIDIQIPATSQAVNRTIHSGAYLQNSADLLIKRIWRNAEGEVAVQTQPMSAALQPGALLTLDGLRSGFSLPWVSKGINGTYPAIASSGASHGSFYSVTQSAPTIPGNLSSGAVLANGDVLVTGGVSYPYTPYNGANRLRLLDQVVCGDDTEASDAMRWRYQWLATANMNAARLFHGCSALLDGRALVSGGNSTYLYVPGFGTATQLASTELYNPGTDTWSLMPAMSLARQNHTQITLNDGRILVVGGTWNGTTATNTTELFDPATLTWSAGPSMAIPRVYHQAVKLNDGRVMVIGGSTLGRQMSVDSATHAYWRMEDAGSTLTDSSANSLNLTVSGSSSQVNGKVSRARSFTGGYATRPGSGSDATVLKGEWTVEFWAQPLASGTIISYGGAGETGGDNVLMEIGISSNKVYWKWEHSGGVDVTGTQTGSLTSSSLPHKFIAVRKKFNGTDYDVTLFVNGVAVDQWAGQTNATGGGSSNWYVAYDPETSTAATATIDELRVSSVARTDKEIASDFLLGKGWLNTPDFPSGDTTNTTEIFDPNSNTWSEGPRMTWARSHHKAFVLKDGRVLVIGGAGRRSDLPLPTYTDFWEIYWPNNGVLQLEAWDATANQWSPMGLAPAGICTMNAEYIPEKDQILVFSSRGFSQINYNGVSSTYYNQFQTLDTNTMLWTQSYLPVSPRDRSFYVRDGVILIAGGNDGGSTNYPSMDLYVSGSDRLSAGSLNGIHTVTSSTISSITFQTPETSDYYSNLNFLIGNGSQAFASGEYVVPTGFGSATRSSNTTTLSFAPNIVAGKVAVGDTVFVNFEQVGGAFASGEKIVTAVADTSLSYADPGAPASASVKGNVSKDSYRSAVAHISAPASNTLGPYVFDVDAGRAITAATTGLTTSLLKHQNYDRIQVADNSLFPDAPGYLVLGFGTSKQSRPIKYLERVGTDLILIDYSYAMEFDYSVGDNVVYIVSRSPFVPGLPSDNENFYATGSSAGRIAAQSITTASAAAGIVLDFNVVYPGDRGLGGEGYPTEGAGKLSDAATVWGDS